MSVYCFGFQALTITTARGRLDRWTPVGLRALCAKRLKVSALVRTSLLTTDYCHSGSGCYLRRQLGEFRICVGVAEPCSQTCAGAAAELGRAPPPPSEVQAAQQAAGTSGPKLSPRHQHKKQRISPRNTAHLLVDPCLLTLQAELLGISLPATVAAVDSPLSRDQRQQPYADNLLDLQLLGEGAPEG